MISWSNFQKQSDQTWVDVMTADDLYHGISLNLVLLILEMILICGKKTSTSYYKVWYIW